MTLPVARPSSTQRSASTTSLNGYRRSMRGLTSPAAIRSLSVADVVRVERLPPDQQAHPLVGRHRNDRPHEERREDRPRRPAERDVDAVRAQRAPDPQDRVVRVGVDDPVVALARARVVDLRVVDHVVGTEGPYEVHLARAADAGHLGAHRFRDLDGERPDVARGAVDQDPIAGLGRSPVAQPQSLDREDGRMWERGGLLEGHAGRHRLEGPLRRADVLGEGALPEGEEVREDLVTRREPGDGRANGLDDARDIDAEAMVPRCAQPHEEADERRPGREPVEIGAVHRCRSDADQHLVIPPASGGRPPFSSTTSGEPYRSRAAAFMVHLGVVLGSIERSPHAERNRVRSRSERSAVAYRHLRWSQAHRRPPRPRPEPRPVPRRRCHGVPCSAGSPLSCSRRSWWSARSSCFQR